MLHILMYNAENNEKFYSLQLFEIKQYMVWMLEKSFQKCIFFFASLKILCTFALAFDKKNDLLAQLV